MFVETIVLPRAEWEHHQERLRIVADPPAGLVATVSWASGDEVTSVNVWETPGAVADFFVERVSAVVEEEGPPSNKPQRHGEPLAFWVRA